MDIESYIMNIGKNAKDASRIMVTVSTTMKNDALMHMAEALIENKEIIIKANNIIKSASQWTKPSHKVI